MNRIFRPHSLVLMAIVLLAAPVFAADLVGRASVVDGDTLDIRDQRVRLHGIDAPESGQRCQDASGAEWRCGQRAALALADRIGRQVVSCEEKDRDRYGRIVAVCRAGSEDLNAWMARQGWALAYREYSDDYVGAEATARAARAGIWAGTFQAPWDWRRDRRSGRQAPANLNRPTAAGCTIKGNVSNTGDRIYHVPGGRFYDRTQINASKGERWFCSEAEAEAAGWRASSR